ncbi:phosphodiester glycosidase family protein [Gloeobacter violaceus]|uniref:phosphodiester glycosidase family protein n=1 Tax=Gloeobacter violaceus TaxID=33072 RepID=UPI0013E8CFB6|nr:phosphodiester glycosidase family protein [Gloeobacter violaceus]
MKSRLRLWLAWFCCLLALGGGSPGMAAPTLGLNIGKRLDEFDIEHRLGVELLDALQPGVQPARFFGSRLDLTVTGGSLRTVDPEQVKRLTGATPRFTGTSQVQWLLPASRIVAVRASHSAEGERLVIELDRPAFYEVIPAESGLRLIVQAAPPPAQTAPTDGVQVTAGLQQTVIAVAGPPNAYPLLTTLGAPDRIVLDWRIAGRFERARAWGVGLVYREVRLVWEGLSQQLHLLEFDPARVRLGLLRPPSLGALAPLSALGNSQGAWGAVNGGFFNRNTREALGALRSDGQWWTGAVAGLPPRGAASWQDGRLDFDRLNWSAAIRTGDQTLPVGALNGTAAGAGLSVFTPEWGSLYLARAGETVAIARADRIESVVEPMADQIVSLPPDGLLLVARSEPLRTALRAVAAGTPVVLDVQPSGSGSLLGAGPLLVQNDKLVLDAQGERFRPDVRAPGVARTAIARRGSLGILAVAARNGWAAGLSLESWANLLLQQFQADDALNLDGGGSSGFYLGGRLRDRPEGSFERPVHNGLGLWLK